VKTNIFIVGFSGTGKSTVGREAAKALGWSFVDTDDVIAETAGQSIEAIFTAHGEARFRDMERRALALTCEGERQVVATGGGIMEDERNRRLMDRNGATVLLEATPTTIHRRLLEEQSESAEPRVRPMLESDEPLDRIRSLKAARQVNYTRARWTVRTDGLTPTQAAKEVVRGWKAPARRPEPNGGTGEDSLAAVVRTSSGEYPVWVGWGTLEEVGDRVRERLAPAAAYVISDEGVFRHARRVQASMEAAGVPTHMFLLPPGEQSKSLEMARHLYSWLAGRRAERGHAVLSVGGGVVGDLGGFVAATFLRGMPFAQVPTSLLAMMDASIGGKVAVDLPQGKNLVGAFYQPRFVLTDVQALASLPDRELSSGWAEALKHGLILDEPLVCDFEERRDEIRALDAVVATDVIRRSVSIKADVVSRDEKETLGVRVLLNYGHTIGHAIEAATGYGSFLHGEAVSVGMMGAAYIGEAMGLMPGQDVARQRRLLESYGLPVSNPGMDVDAVSQAMLSDKKTVGKSIRWVLLDGIGKAVVRDDVPPEVVTETLERLAE
jgi:3-dehydroquinate synthase